MRSLFYPDYGELELRDIPVPTPGDDEVLLRVAACGICGSELETFKARNPRRRPPLVMGHEFCGEVVSVGRALSDHLVGKRFVSNSLVSCGNCVRCERGDTHLCAHRTLFGMHRQGAFAEFVTVPERALIAWPDNLSAGAACLAEPLANGVHTVNLTRHIATRSVLVIGAGPIGLMCQQAFQAMRGASVMVTDLSSSRLKVAQKLGATSTVCSKEADLIAEVMSWTGGEGVDVVIDAAGSGATKTLALSALRPGGATVWIGLHGDQMDLSSYSITLPEKQVLGSYAATQAEMGSAIELMGTDRADVISWVESTSIDRAAQTFHRMATPGEQDIKAVIIP